MAEDILEAFAAETREILEAVEKAIAGLESGDKETVDELFRHIHTIKGSAGIVGMPRLEAFAHAWETRLGRVRQGQARFGSASYRALEACRAHVSSILDETRPTIGAASISAEGLDEEDMAILSALDATMGETDSLPAAQPDAVPADLPIAAEGGETGMPTAGAETARRETNPADPAPTARSDAAERLRNMREKARKAGERAQITDAFARIPSSKLEKILSQSGEIVVALSNFAQSARVGGANGLVYELAAVESLAASLYRSVLEARMVPFGEIAGRFVKAVDEIARDRGARIRFVLSGAETEIDKSLADRLIEPLLHLVRNAADHGIELPESRAAAGKNPEGIVALRAKRESGLLSVRIEDDGAGIDPAAIREIALRQGRIAEEDRLDDEELFELLFEPGFSLSGQVTRWSGRGVGLDVVKKTVAAIRGTVRIQSRKGEGSVVTVRLPLALSLVEGFVARVGELELLVPFDATAACFEFDDAGGDSPWRTVSWMGNLLPAIDLGALYLGPTGAARRIAIVLEDSGSHIALVVDEVGETISAAVRPLDRKLADSPGIAGSAIRGDGSMVLVLDTAELGLMALRGRRGR